MKMHQITACQPVTVTCSTCGTAFETRSVCKSDIRVEVCSQCHPAYTGEQSKITRSDQIDKFNQKYPSRNKMRW